MNQCTGKVKKTTLTADVNRGTELWRNVRGM